MNRKAEQNRRGREMVYVMKNANTGAVVEATEKFLVQWIARGFEVVEVRRVPALVVPKDRRSIRK